MTAFTQIPEHYTPLGGQALYAFENDSACTVDLRIIDAANGSLLGAKRFASVTGARFDASPILRRALGFTPSEGGTGVYPADGRRITARAEAFTEELTASSANPISAATPAPAASPAAIAPARIFLPCNAPASRQPPANPATAAPAASSAATPTAAAPAATPATATPATPISPGLLTTMPLTRLIGPGECDELTLLCEGACTVRVTALGARAPSENAPSENAPSKDTPSENAPSERLYPIPAAGLHLFRLDTRDFAGAERLLIDAGGCGRVEYTLLAPPEGSVRLAWRSTAGSIEHYTFPEVCETSVRSTRREAYGPGGHIASATEQRHRQRVVSACEGEAVLKALAELGTTPQAWIASPDGYTPVTAGVQSANSQSANSQNANSQSAKSQSVVVARGGEPCRMEAYLEPVFNTRLPWN